MEDDDVADLVDLADLYPPLRDVLVGVTVPVLGVALGGDLHLLPVLGDAVPVDLRHRPTADFHFADESAAVGVAAVDIVQALPEDRRELLLPEKNRDKKQYKNMSSPLDIGKLLLSDYYGQNSRHWLHVED